MKLRTSSIPSRRWLLVVALAITLLALAVLGRNTLLASEEPHSQLTESAVDVPPMQTTGKDGVTIAEEVSLTVAMASVVTAGQPADLVATVSDPFYYIQWDFGDGSPLVETGLLTITHTYAAAGDYTATATLYDIYSTPLTAVTLDVRVEP